MQNKLRNYTGVIGRFLINRETGKRIWEDTYNVIRHFYLNKHGPMVVSPIYLSKVVSLPDKIIAQIVTQAETTPGPLKEVKKIWKKTGTILIPIYFTITLLLRVRVRVHVPCP
jgi:hypothetical protein